MHANTHINTHTHTRTYIIHPVDYARAGPAHPPPPHSSLGTAMAATHTQQRPAPLVLTPVLLRPQGGQLPLLLVQLARAAPLPAVPPLPCWPAPKRAHHHLLQQWAVPRRHPCIEGGRTQGIPRFVLAFSAERASGLCVLWLGVGASSLEL